ncbi:nuclear transport factor 2 family protein [Streptomyces sp. KN37]|uniref:nuclear transport factor 2 family protein n=1 Tax=Streptomyces sp. KN37 TaxID=3090667 RepID=UPI002A74EC5F|nr:nuclear transport factor 2 family protein [Streptomyces sp. KN37]WPO70540.1 nuclear transport factor 2 family protein [Streptomyces sp. KN37]
MATTTAAEQPLLDLVREWSAAELAGDCVALGDLLTGDFVGVGPQGYLRTREQWLARYSSGAVRTTSFTVDEVRVRLYGDTAVLIAAQTQRSTNKGDNADGAFRFTLIAVREEGRWLLAGLHVSPNAAAAATT